MSKFLSSVDRPAYRNYEGYDCTLCNKIYARTGQKFGDWIRAAERGWRVASDEKGQPRIVCPAHEEPKVNVNINLLYGKYSVKNVTVEGVGECLLCALLK